MNIMVIAPHADDEVLGCGGLIRKKNSENHNVYVLIVTKGSPNFYSPDKVKNVRNEAIKAHEILGVKETYFFDFHAPELDITSTANIASAITEKLKQLNIEELYIPHRGDVHSDHKVVANACYVAIRPINNLPIKAVYAYETLSETEWAPPFGDDAFIPDHFVNITNFLDYKLNAMRCFKSQLKEFPHPRSIKTITALAQYRGSTVGVEFAESFMSIRSIEL
jgi:LmbE family N-acetylglucosaminyl deacetylase